MLVSDCCGAIEYLDTDLCTKYLKTFRQLHDQIKAGSKQNLPKWVRNWLIKQFEENAL